MADLAVVPGGSCLRTLYLEMVRSIWRERGFLQSGRKAGLGAWLWGVVVRNVWKSLRSLRTGWQERGVRWHGGGERGRRRSGGLREDGALGWLAATLCAFPANSKAFFPLARVFCFP